MASVRDLFATLGLDFDAAGFASAIIAAEGVEEALKLAGKAVIALGEALVASVTDTAAYADNLDETAQRVGVGVEALQSLQYAAERSGSSAEQLTQALGLLGVAATEAAHGGKEQAEAFQKLGISTKDLEKQPLDETLKRIAKGLDRVSSAAEKTELVRKVLGRGGSALLPMLANGGEELRALEARFKALGVGLDRNAVSSMAELHELLEDVKLALSGIGRELGIALGPTVRKLAVGALGFIKRLRDGTSELYSWLTLLTQTLKLAVTAAISAVIAKTVLWTAALFANGGASSYALWWQVELMKQSIRSAVASASAWAAAAWPFVALGVLIGGLILLIEDLGVWAAGGKSLIGELVDEWMKPREGDNWFIKAVKMLLVLLRGDLGIAIYDVWESFKTAADNAFQWVINQIAGFGGRISAAFKGALSAAMPGGFGWMSMMGNPGSVFGGGSSPAASAAIASSGSSPASKVIAPTMNSNFTIHSSPGMSASDVGSEVDKVLRRYHEDKLREADAASGG